MATMRDLLQAAAELLEGVTCCEGDEDCLMESDAQALAKRINEHLLKDLQKLKRKELLQEDAQARAFARRTDPSTAKEAAAALGGSARLNALESTTVDLVRGDPGRCMADHCETALDRGLVTSERALTPRFAPLVRKRAIHIHGTVEPRKWGGRKGQAYWPGPEGSPHCPKCQQPELELEP